MDLDSLRRKLPIGRLGEPVHYFTSIGSTNDRAKELAEEGIPSGGLVLADEQTAGRGRWGRSWFTPAGSALALSVVLRPGELALAEVRALNVLGALAVANALERLGGNPGIKWPNDVLLNGRKVAGILVEGSWQETELDYVIIGVGVNVRPESVPPEASLEFPATCVEAELGGTVSRQDLLIKVLAALDDWLAKLGSKEIVEAWNDRLAYRNQRVELQGQRADIQGELVRVEADGRIVLELDSGERKVLGQDFVRLRPVDRNPG